MTRDEQIIWEVKRASRRNAEMCDEAKTDLAKAMEQRDPLHAQTLASYIDASYLDCLWERALSLLVDGTDLFGINEQHRLKPSADAAGTLRAVMQAVPVPAVPDDEIRPVAIAGWKVESRAHRHWIVQCEQILAESGS